MHDAMLRGMCHTTAWCLSFRLVVRLSVLSRCRIETDERITVPHTGFRSKQFGKLENETPQKRRKIAPFYLRIRISFPTYGTIVTERGPDLQNILRFILRLS